MRGGGKSAISAMSEADIIQDAVDKQHLHLDKEKTDLEALVRYARFIGYAEGWKDRNSYNIRLTNRSVCFVSSLIFLLVVIVSLLIKG
jgi:hypothetical protein